MNNRNETLDFIRGIAILIVIMGHALLCALYDRAMDNWLYQLIISFQMALLMFISGVSAGYSFPTKKPLDFLKKKIMRLLIPYLCWTLIYTILNTLACDKAWSIGVFLTAFYSSEFWFLRFLFMFYVVLVIVNVLYMLLGEKQSALYILLILSVGLVYAMSKIPYVKQSISVWYYLWFMLGMLIFSKLELLKKNLVLFQAFGVAIIDAMAVMLIAILFRGEVRSTLTGAVWTIGICFVCYFARKMLPAALVEKIAQIGKNTLPIYAIHWCLLFAPWHNAGWFVRLTSKLAVAEWILALLFFVYLLVATLGINWLLKKWSVTGRLLLGEKR